MATSIRGCFSAFRHLERLVSRSFIHTQSLAYAKKMVGGKMMGQAMEKVRLEVETDAEKLAKYCCGANILTSGSDPEIKPDSEYPQWLWELRTDRKPLDITELDENDIRYWRRLRSVTIKRKNRMLGVERIKK
ncbi:39S ribosomal protein L54, mitochondrial-like [Gigantopelta aegis]|uniref:39S ribosomal protein L54, mitochondrial-like n=1 Tax=Gigantopelta aegis TaxID=1735272 RepID=UPI001B88A840|nr:39S ribosomal protein L54, mitochondrial-like [Gigantopelta aegis]